MLLFTPSSKCTLSLKGIINKTVCLANILNFYSSLHRQPAETDYIRKISTSYFTTVVCLVILYRFVKMLSVSNSTVL